MTDILESIDVVLTEDGKTILLYGYAADDRCWLQSFALPAAITEDNVVDDEWRAAAHPERWHPVG